MERLPKGLGSFSQCTRQKLSARSNKLFPNVVGNLNFWLSCSGDTVGFPRAASVMDSAFPVESIDSDRCSIVIVLPERGDELGISHKSNIGDARIRQSSC